MNLLDKIIFIFLFGFLLFIGLNRHARHPRFDYHSQLFTDKSGYHVYLPAFFYYDMDACLMPEGIVEKTGRGFRLVDDKIVTKYPIGVAILHSPFFGLAAIYDSVLKPKQELGYSEAHHVAINWSTVFYTTFGLILLWLTAINHWKLSKSKAYLLVFLLLFVSNLLYYTTRDAGMSHAFSFFTFSGLQYILFRVWSNRLLTLKEWVVIVLLGSLVIALRPLNIIFILFPMAYFFFTKRSEVSQIAVKVNWKGLSLGGIIGLTPLLLQLAYNFYAYNGPFARGYAAETFSNIAHMDLIRLWFAPDNGVFMYIPCLLLVLVWCVDRLRNGKISALIYFGYFLVISVVYAAWWSPTLGCGFGHRGFTEHLALFAFPISNLLSTAPKQKIQLIWVLGVILAAYLFIWQWNFDGCWYGNNPWDWKEYLRLLRC